MKVFIAGATGVLGRRLIPHLTERGHIVTGLAHHPRAVQTIAELGGIPHPGSLFDPAGLAAGMQGADVVIHAATRIPNKLRPSLKDFQENDRIRIDGTRTLAQAALQAGVRTFVYQSIVWVTQPVDGSFFDEDTPPNPGPVERSSLEAERLAAGMLQPQGIHVAILRGGMFYGPDSFATLGMGQTLRRGFMPVFGSGQSLWSVIHHDDIAAAFTLAAEQGRAGLWHVVDDRPVSAFQFLSTLAQLLGAAGPRRIPLWLGKLLFGATMAGLLSRQMNTSNARFRRDFGWSPQYPNYRLGLEQVVSTWRKDRQPWLPVSSGSRPAPGSHAAD